MLIAKEQVNRTDLLMQQNELLVKQNEHLRNLALSTRKIDEFNHLTFNATSGYEVPDAKDVKGVHDFKNTQGQEREAINDTYYSDLSIGGGDYEEES